MFLMWYDDNPKRTAEQKTQAAIIAYQQRFTANPNVVLVNEEEQGIAIEGVTIRAEKNIRKNNYWVGLELDN